MEILIQRKIILALTCLGLISLANAAQVNDNTARSMTYPEALITSDAIAGGLYLNTNFDTRPLLAISHDGGTSWSYPSTIISKLPSNIAQQALFTGAMCSGRNCVASGYYEQLLSTGNRVAYPLLASSKDRGNTWSYPPSIESTLPSDFTEGSFVGTAWCSGSNCIAAGKYRNTANLSLPLIAVSHDAGSSWNYPPSVVSNLPPNFLNQASFTDDTCKGTACFATGQYRNTDLIYIPFLAYSQDGGNAWSYPPSIYANLPADFNGAGIFNSISCGDAACTAVGNYSSTKAGNPDYPLIAVSNDAGKTWLYPSSTATQLPSDFVSMITMNQVYCGQNNCVAVGQYQSSQGNQKKYPFLISSQDAGHTWTYPLTVVTGLPPDFQSIASFNSVRCDMNTCIAVGSYQSSTYAGQQIPLVAASYDGGKTWVYPGSITTSLPFDLSNGQLLSVSCNRSDCTAKGQYQSEKAGIPYYPLVATSHDSGVTWTYPSSVISNLSADYNNDGIFTSGKSSHNLLKK